jgi:hypothetical protein
MTNPSEDSPAKKGPDLSGSYWSPNGIGPLSVNQGVIDQLRHLVDDAERAGSHIQARVFRRHLEIALKEQEDILYATHLQDRKKKK